jgi:aspartyl-tRNA(Asn)/glutamyl-tRNA(Gln) amidotransferase subunit A
MAALNELTARELSGMLHRGEVSAAEALDAVLGAVRARDDELKCYVTVTEEIAREQARAAEEALREGSAGPWTGIPIAIKDNQCTKGVRTTCSSKILGNYVPPYDATVVEKLRAAGAVMVGKANMDEFAMGSSTENSGFFPTLNPRDTSCVPGGSSGGSAAAVAAGLAIAATGSDTGGSIREPASFCGVVGIKPTYGRVSRYGLVAFASSLDQIGPITRDVTDCAMMLQVLAGHDPRDATSVDLPVPDYTAALTGDISELRIGVIREMLAEGIDSEVAASVRAAVDQMADAAAACEEVSLPHLDYALACYYIIAPAEASSNLARYDGVKYGHRAAGDLDMIEMYKRTRAEGFGPEVKRRIMIGTYALSAGYYDAYYLKAQQVRTLIRRDFEKALEHCDVIVGPTCPNVAFKLGEKIEDPLEMYLADVCTVALNLAGNPGISVPCGFKDGLPIGMQIMGRPFDEETVLRAAHAYEQMSG